MAEAIEKSLKKDKSTFREGLEQAFASWEEEKKKTGGMARRRVELIACDNLAQAKKERSFHRRINRRLNRLERRNPKSLQIDHPFDLLATKEDEDIIWVDVMVKLPRLFRWEWQWLFTMLSDEAYKTDSREAIEYGTTYPIQNSQDNADKFDNIYFDHAITRQNIVECYEEWIKIFLPDFVDRLKVGGYGDDFK